MSRLLTKTENPDGLYYKYYIEKVNGEPVDRDTEYFILRLDKHGKDIKHLEACRKAVLVYAEEIKDHLPKLSADLIERYS